MMSVFFRDSLLRDICCALNLDALPSCWCLTNSDLSVAVPLVLTGIRRAISTNSGVQYLCPYRLHGQINVTSSRTVS